MLADYYGIHPQDRVSIAGRDGLLADSSIYFNMESSNLETIQLEQAVLSYYLFENGYQHIALPIKNRREEWFTDYHNRKFLVYQVRERNITRESLGSNLAQFHQIGSTYNFEPQSVSSYGAWKQLWIEKLNGIEERVQQLTEQQNSKYLLDLLPYIIGMSENAIQYLRETEEMESRFSEVDQGTITFLRFREQFHEEVIWPDQLGYDHPARDLAEHIRFLFLAGYRNERLQEFLRDYQLTRPLSFFSLRLIYARLLFPIQLFDFIEPLVYSGDLSKLDSGAFEQLIRQQAEYEERLKDFYEKIGINKDEVQLFEVDWL